MERAKMSAACRWLVVLCLVLTGWSQEANATPDLIVTSLKQVPARVIKGQKSKVEVCIKNQGWSATTTGFLTQVIYSTTNSLSTFSPIAANEAVNTNLTAGQSACFTWDFTIPTSARTGRYWLGAFVDGNNGIAESDENNNLSQAYPFLVAGPDFVVTSLTGVPKAASPNQQFALRACIKNIGGDDHKNRQVAVGVYLSTDATITVFDRQLDFVNFQPPIAKGATVCGNLNIRIPFNLSTTPNWLGAIVDTASNVSEENETNNVGQAYKFTLPLPDLKITTITGLPAGLAPGDWVNINACIKNEGTKDAPASNLEFYMSMDDNIDPNNDQDIALAGLPPIKIGQTHCVDLQLKMPAILPPRGYWIGAMIDPSNLFTESDEANNKFKKKLSNSSKYVDFSVGFGTFSGGNFVKPGDPFSMIVCVSNTGTIDATKPVKVGLFFAHSPSISVTFSYKISTYNLTLKAGQQDCRTVNEKYPPNMSPSQSGTLGVIVDYDKEFNDPDRKDNTRTVPITVTTFPQPDLSVTSITAPSSAVKVGSQISLKVCVKNQGAGDAAAFAISLHYSRTQLFGDKLPILATINVSAGLKAGATTCPSAQVSVPPKVLPGAKDNYFAAFADYNHKVFETDDFLNNKRSVAFSVQSFTRPDLVVSSLTNVPATTGQSSSFQVRACVKNSGTADAFQPSVSVYFSDRPITDSNNAKVGHATLPSPLKAGATACAQVSVTLKPGFPAGNVRLAAIADGDDAVAEINEKNNVSQNASMRILGPDLALTSFSITPPEANFTRWGELFKVKYCVKNISTTTDVLKPFKVAIFDSRSQVISMFGSRLYTHSYTQADLAKFKKNAAGDCQTVLLNTTRQVPAGRRYMGAVVDPDLVLREDGVGPNTTDPGIPYYIVSKVKPNLVITSITPPTKMIAGTSAPVKVCYANHGIATKAGARFDLELYYLPTSTAPPTTPLLRTTITQVPTPSAVACTTVNLTIPNTAQAGKRWLEGKIDTNTQIDEANEGDNDTRVPVDVQVVVDADKDGVPQDADCNDKDKTIFPAYKGKPAAPELCDGKDNDCNKKIDEGYPKLGQSCSAGVGDCQASGKFVCDNAGKSTTCSASPGTPTPETCDGKDNNCNGQIDDGATCPQGMICLKGQCMGTSEPPGEPDEEPLTEPMPEPEPAKEPSPEPQKEPAAEPRPREEPATPDDASSPQDEPPGTVELVPDKQTQPDKTKPEPTPEPQADAAPPTGCNCQGTPGVPLSLWCSLVLLGLVIRKRRTKASR